MAEVEMRIADMTLMEARRSLMIQVAEIRALESEIGGLVNGTVGEISDEEVTRITDSLIVKHENIMQTAEQIDELKADEAEAQRANA